MDSLHVDKTISDFNNDFEVEKFAKQFDVLSKTELEQVIAHCNMLIERNNIKMGGV